MEIDFGCRLNAETVDTLVAKRVAARFLEVQGIGTANSHLVYCYTGCTANTNGCTPAFYVFNIEPIGFVMVAAQKCIQPILAWSGESVFDSGNIYMQVADLLSSYKKQSAYVINKNLMPTEAVAKSWEALTTTGMRLGAKTTAVAPMLHTNWNQNGFYNYLCPQDPKTKKKALTGCVATVMAQLMRYWQWPAKGIGFHSYHDSAFGTQNADFGRTVYKWAYMPYTVSNPNPQVENLMYQAGVSVDMAYGINSSSSYVLSKNCPIRNNAQFALENYFCYKAGTQGLYRKNYNDNDWLALIKAELDNGRPLIYDGANDTEGHSFIADGYDAYNNIHFNWGWGGAFNGYFTLNNLSPDSINFMQGNEILIGIAPDTARKLVMADSVAPLGVLVQKQPFSLLAKVINVDTSNFNLPIAATVSSDYTPGYFSGAQFAAQQIIWGDSLTLKFDFAGLLAGSYHVHLYYILPNGAQVAVAKTAEYNNNTPIIINGDPNTDMFTAYPNPAPVFLYLDLNNSAATHYALYDAAGREVLNGNIDAGQPVVPIPVTGLDLGVYILSVEAPNGRQVKKVVVGR